MGIFKNIIRIIQLHMDSTDYWRKRGAIIGDNCDIHTTASLGSEPYLVRVGNNVRINAGVQITTHDGGVWVIRHSLKEYENIDLFRTVTIGNNVHIGTNAMIMPGISIGDNCIIGVGAIVTRNIPDGSIAVGIPARVIETIDEYIEKHKNDFLYTKNMSFNEKKEYLLNNLHLCQNGGEN